MSGRERQAFDVDLLLPWQVFEACQRSK